MKAFGASIGLMILTLVGVVALLPVPLSAQKQNAGTIVYEHTPVDKPPLSGPTDIYSLKADGTNVKALTSDGQSYSPSWSPDGRRILFLRGYPIDPGELWEMDRDGSNPRLLHRLNPAHRGVPAWLPDGSALSITTRTGLYILREQGQRESRLLQLFPTSPALAFALSQQSQGEPRLLFRNVWGVIWSPDGKKLAFFSAPGEVHVSNADGSDDVKLTDYGSYPNARPSAWSPDGKQIAFAAGSQVFLINADGSGVRQLTTDPNWLCSQATWSPDGRLIVVSCSPKGDCFGAGSWAVLPSKLECRHRLFAISPLDPQAKLIQISDQNARSPVFAPVQ